MEIVDLKEEYIPQIVLLEEEILHETLGVEMLTNEIYHSVSHFKVCVDGKKVIGYIGGFIVEGYAELYNFVVDEAYQRRGIGQALFDSLIGSMKDINKLILEVRADNIKGKSFYLKNGFKEIAIRKHYYYDGMDAVVMEKLYI